MNNSKIKITQRLIIGTIPDNSTDRVIAWKNWLAMSENGRTKRVSQSRVFWTLWLGHIFTARIEMGSVSLTDGIFTGHIRWMLIPVNRQYWNPRLPSESYFIFSFLLQIIWQKLYFSALLRPSTSDFSSIFLNYSPPSIIWYESSL